VQLTITRSLERTLRHAHSVQFICKKKHSSEQRTFYFYPDGVSVYPSRLPPKVVSSSTGPILSISNPKPGPLFQYGAPPFKLAPPPNTRKNSRACLPRLQLRNVGYNKTTLRSGCTLFLTRVSNVTARLSANDSRVAKASAQRRASRSTRDTPRTLKSGYLQKETYFRAMDFFSTRTMYQCFHADYTEGGFFQYRARLRSLQALLGVTN